MTLPKVRESNTAWYVTKEGKILTIYSNHFMMISIGNLISKMAFAIFNFQTKTEYEEVMIYMLQQLIVKGLPFTHFRLH